MERLVLASWGFYEQSSCKPRTNMALSEASVLHGICCHLCFPWELGVKRFWLKLCSDTVRAEVENRRTSPLATRPEMLKRALPPLFCHLQYHGFALWIPAGFRPQPLLLPLLRALLLLNRLLLQLDLTRWWREAPSSAGNKNSSRCGLQQHRTWCYSTSAHLEESTLDLLK